MLLVCWELFIFTLLIILYEFAFSCQKYLLLHFRMYLQDEDSETEEFDADRKKFNSQKGNDTRQGMSFRAFQKVSGGNMANDNFVHEGSRRQLEEDQSIRSLKSEGSFNISKGELDVKNGENTIGSSYHTFNKSEDYDSSEMHGIGKVIIW